MTARKFPLGVTGFWSVTRQAFRRCPRLLGALSVLLAGLVTLLVLDRIFPPPLEKAVSGSMLVTDRAGIPLRAFPTSEGRWRLPADTDAIDPAFLAALIGVEDERFHSHMGVDGLAVIRAAKSAVQRGRIVSGASTITMQTARLLEPRPRTLPSKFIEMLRAVQLEMRLSKKEILDLYLTLTPYGGNLEGVRAASWAYFGREPDRLSDDQIALLIALPQSPEVRRPDLRPKSALAARALILDRLVDLEIMSDQRAKDAKSLPLPGRHAFPAYAWHASAQVREIYRASPRGPYDLPHDLKTSLDAGLQTALETFFKEKAETIGNGVQYSAIVIDIETRKVRAHIGSATRKRPGGWMDLTRSARSPGSTLKPFIYGLSFDDGVALPNTFIEDLPARFNTYRPENFDRTFRGQVRIKDALQHSLNVPAVLALERIGPERFAAALTLSGVDVQVHTGADREAGLALALGGAGMTVQDLGKLYAGLGDNGVVKPLSWLEADRTTGAIVKGHRFMSETSADKIIDILKSAPTPSGRMPARLTKDAPEIAFKTGTSYGFRDAWAAGIARGYAVIVWAGRADGAPRPGETGRKTALPLLFSVFDKVDSILGAEGQASDRLLVDKKETPHFSMVDFAKDDQPPMILFPPENAVLLQKRPDHPSPGFVLSGRGEGELRWFVNGQVIERDAAGAPVWVPSGPGFFTLAAVDENGRESRVRVRVSSLTN